jgi:RND family efflux transporter MFP subunit
VKTHSLFYKSIPLASLTAAAIVSLVSGCRQTPTAEGGGADAGAKPAPVVRIAVASLGTIEETLPTSAVIRALPNQEAAIAPPVAGILDSLPIHYGQEVARGQVIAHLSTQSLMGQIQQAQATIDQNTVQVEQAQVAAIQQRGQTRAAVLQAQSALANAQATLAGARATLTGNEAAVTNAQDTLTREEKLFHEGLVAEKDVEAARLTLQTALAQADAQRQTVYAQRQTVAGQKHAVEAARTGSLQDLVKRKDIDVARQQLSNARGALATYRAQLALYTMRAPLSGEITAVGATPGTTVDTTTKIATIANLGSVQLEVSVPAESAGSVHAGQYATFQADGIPGKVFQATIQKVGSQVDTTNNTVTAIAPIHNPGHILKDDETAKVQIVVRRKDNTVVVPQTAVLTDPATGEKTVATVGSDQTLHIVPVKLGISSGGNVEIVSGLSPGTQVATSGQYAVPDGTKVSIAHAP